MRATSGTRCWERDARVGRQEVPARARADDLLDHHAHLLVHVEQAPLGAVFDRVGPNTEA